MVTIVADTTSTLSVEEAKSLGVPYLPQIIIFGEDSYRDDGEIDTPTFLKKLREFTGLPKTAAPSPALYAPVYEELLARGESIVVLTPSEDVSGTYRGAFVAAQDFPGKDIHVVDTRTVAAGLGTLVRQSVKWAKAGLSPEEIVKNIKSLASQERIFFYVDTLEFLHKKGRIGGAKALVGSVLQIKPILTVGDGRIQPFEQQRTKKRAISRVLELIIESFPKNQEPFLQIMQGDALEDALWFKEQFATQLGIKDVPIVELPPAIIVHAGPGTLAISYFMDPQ